MPQLETYRKRAKLLMRWHQQRNYSVGGLVRQLDRFRALTDAEVLAMPFPLALAQEVTAIEAGFANWAALKAASAVAEKAPVPDRGPPVARAVVPILFVTDVTAAAHYYRDRLGFAIDFLHGHPPFYASVSRDAACLHLRFVHRPCFAELAQRETGLILASIEVSNVWALHEEVRTRGADIALPMRKEAWGGTNFHARDPDGNVLSFVTYSGG